MLLSNETAVMNYYSTATATATTAGTTILVPSTSTGKIMLKKIVISNGATAGSAYFGWAAAGVAPTTSAILINNIYVGVAGLANLDFFYPIALPASKNLVITAVSCTNITFAATYYVNP